MRWSTGRLVEMKRKGEQELHNIGESLRELREERDLKQKEVADALFISNKLLSSYERGISQPPIDMLIRICEYYRVSADMLLGLKEQEEESHLPGTEVSGDAGSTVEMPGLPSGGDARVSRAPEDVSGEDGLAEMPGHVSGEAGGSLPGTHVSGDDRLAEDRRLLAYYHRLDAESQEAIRGLLIYYCKEQEHRREMRAAEE